MGGICHLKSVCFMQRGLFEGQIFSDERSECWIAERTLPNEKSYDQVDEMNPQWIAYKSMHKHQKSLYETFEEKTSTALLWQSETHSLAAAWNSFTDSRNR